MMTPNIGKSSVWNWLCVTTLAPRILKLILEYALFLDPPVLSVTVINVVLFNDCSQTVHLSVKICYELLFQFLIGTRQHLEDCDAAERQQGSR
jgi:hypothetical protein